MLNSDRLLFLQLEEKDAPEVLDFYLANGDFLEAWEPLRAPDFMTLAYHQKSLRLEQTKYKNGNFYKFWLRLKTPQPLPAPPSPIPPLVGCISLTEIVRGCFDSCYMGYKIHKDFLNRGLASEAIATIVQFAFHDLQLHRIEANIMPRNLASLRAVQKNGFQSEGLSPKYMKINGVWEDHLHMVIRNSALE